MPAATDLYETLLSDQARRAVAIPQMGGRQAEFPFTFGLPDPLSFPGKALTRVARTVLSERVSTALQYGNYQGDPELRQVIAERLHRLEGVELGPENILVTNGSAHGIALVAQALVNPGDAVVVEGPTFLGAVRIFELFAPRVVEVPLDRRGMRVEELERSLRTLERQGVRPKLIYCLPIFQNPAGVTLSLDRRKKLIALAEQFQIPILEDDAYGELRFEGRVLPSLLSLDTNGLVLRTGTFSKTLGAGMRLGYIAGPTEAIARIVRLKVDGGTNPFASHFATAFAREGLLDRHVRLLRRVYKERRDAMLTALEDHCARYATWTRPQGGFFVWLTFKPGVDPQTVLAEARERGVVYLPGVACYASGAGANEARLSYSFLTPDRIREGIARLGEAMEAAAERAPVAAGAAR